MRLSTAAWQTFGPEEGKRPQMPFFQGEVAIQVYGVFSACRSLCLAPYSHACVLFLYLHVLTDTWCTDRGHDSCRLWTIPRDGRSRQRQVKRDFDGVPVQALAEFCFSRTPFACTEM